VEPFIREAGIHSSNKGRVLAPTFSLTEAILMVTFIRTEHMVVADSPDRMVMCMKAHGLMELERDLGSFSARLEQSIKDFGRKTFSMERDLRSGQMARRMTASSRMVKKWVEVFSSGQMARYTQVWSKITE